MPLQAATVVNQVRLLGASPNTNQGRWADSSILSYIDMAQQHLVQETVFPESRLTGLAVTNVQLYQLPDEHRVYRVYLNGQICVETFGGIDTLEGRQVGLYDSSGQGTAVVGGDGPGGGSTAQPMVWGQVTPQAYPYLQDFGPPTMLGPAGVGRQPQYYRRTGSIGFTPAPANAAEITIDGVFVPPSVGTDTQYLTVPQYFYDALVWYAIMLMKFSDDTSSTQDQRNWAETQFEKHLKRLRTTVRQYSLEKAAYQVRTDRYLYSFGRRTNGPWGNGSSSS